MSNILEYNIFAIYVSNINGDHKQCVLQSVILLLCMRFLTVDS